MEFPAGITVYRDRRREVPSRYVNETRPGSWDDVDTIEIPEAFVASSSSSSLRNATRSQILTAKSLYLGDVTADVQPGDRIRFGSSALYVHERPEADTNPFTGWTPVVEIPLESTEG
ncbi:hypothetical protein EOG37_01180 [Clavibacter michiganensis subsp. michiganensis]|uniref:hypothetical protein n=1 Tax=Clavibacter michiganensis TaxID=28447 RepID=UPI001C645DB7|nr:hypothetical protein [Clavibacter michiganensis]MBW8025294.1 hypothetical protein [Clavibacter michiganensis subsp. michiganensis]